MQSYSLSERPTGLDIISDEVKFKFAKIPMRIEISDWIKINTKASSVPYPRKPYSLYSTHRNASTLVDNWRRELSGNDKHFIERNCMSVIKILGYLPSKEIPKIRKILHLLILSTPILSL